MTGSWKKRVSYGLIAFLAAGGFVWAMRERPVMVDVAEIVEAPMAITVREEGVTRVREIYSVSAPISGYLTRIVLHEGDRVTAGETVVASIRPLEPPLIDRRTHAELQAARNAAQAAVRLAGAELKRAETALNLAEEELERVRRLHGPGIVSQSAFDRAANEVEMLRSSVNAAKATIAVRTAELASAEARLIQKMPVESAGDICCVNLFAPVSGSVLSVLPAPNRPFPPERGLPR